MSKTRKKRKRPSVWERRYYAAEGALAIAQRRLRVWIGPDGPETLDTETEVLERRKAAALRLAELEKVVKVCESERKCLLGYVDVLARAAGYERAPGTEVRGEYGTFVPCDEAAPPPELDPDAPGDYIRVPTPFGFPDTPPTTIDDVARSIVGRVKMLRERVEEEQGEKHAAFEREAQLVTAIEEQKRADFFMEKALRESGMAQATRPMGICDKPRRCP